MDSLSTFTGMELWQKLGTSVEILLPLAISFYTFQLIALQVDIHRDLIPEKISSLDYFLFIRFFSSADCRADHEINRFFAQTQFS